TVLSRKSKLFVALLLLPSLLITLVFYFIPAVMTAAMSFTDMDYRLSWNFIGWDNFKRMAQDFLLPRIMKNTLVYTFATLALFNVGFSVVLALVTSFVPERTGRIFQALWLLPRFTPPIVYGVMWMWILDPTRNGLLNSLAAGGGGRPGHWFGQYPIASVVITGGVVGLSFGMIIFSSAVQSIPRAFIRAA